MTQMELKFGFFIVICRLMAGRGQLAGHPPVSLREALAVIEGECYAFEVRQEAWELEKTTLQVRGQAERKRRGT